MKTKKIVLVKVLSLLLVSFFLTVRVLAQTGVKEQLVVPLSEPGKPYKVTVHTLNGSIKVVGYEGKDIVIDVLGDSTQKHRDGGEGSGGMHRIGGGSGLEVSAQENDNTVTVNGGLSKLSGISLKIPANLTSLKLNTVNDGNITVSNVSGELELNNVNGSITVRDVSGSVVANTVNGPVVVTFKSIDAKAPMAFSTLNGNVDVTFPADLKSNVKLKTDQGGVFTDYEIAVDKSQPVVKKTEENHMYRLNVDSWIYGKINGGGPEMMMKTMTGSIYIRKAK
jgi:Putative adhesin